MSDSDDGKPLVFKRNITTAKQNPSNLALKKPSSQKTENQPVKQFSQARPSNGQSSKTLNQNDRPAGSTKSSQEKSPIGSPKASNSSAKSSSIGHMKASDSGADQSKRPPLQRPAPKEEKQLNNLSAKPENSDDDKPLSDKTQKHSKPVVSTKSSQEKSPIGSPKASNSSAKSSSIGHMKASDSGANQLKRPPPQRPAPKEEKQLNSLSAKPEDLDDDKPLSVKTQKHSKPVVSTKSAQEKSPIGSPKASNSSAKSSSIGHMKAGSGADQPKRPPPQRATPKEERQLNSLAANPEDSDDDMPLNIRPTPKEEKQLNSLAAKPEDSDDDKPLSFKTQKHSKPVVPTKSSQEKSPIGSPKASNSSAKSSSIGNMKASVSGADQSKRPLPPKTTPATKVDKPLKREDDSEDSEDDRPLSSRTKAGLSNHANSSQKPKVETEDSDDEIPLSTKFNKKPNAGPSTSNSHDIHEKKPLVSKVQQNGAIKKSPTMANKRPLGETQSLSQSSVKKPKLGDGSSSSNAKQAPAKAKSEIVDEDDDDMPISQRIKAGSTSANKSSVAKGKVTKVVSKTTFKKSSKTSKKVTKKTKFTKSSKMLPGSGEGKKWNTLVHSGVIFPPPYTPHGVKMLYKGKPVDLTPEQEEVATMYAVMLETEYMTKPKFKENFWTDWRKILGKNHVIQKLDDCDFSPIYEWHQREKEKKKQMTTDEKKAIKEEKLKLEEKYMWAVVDGIKEKVGNFRVEPPGLFRGRGEHPKMGKLKKRIRPSDITINIGRDAPIPECPVPGESWKEIRHDNTVTWLAYWIDPINSKEFKYVFLAASSSLKGQSDKEKYEKARMLKNYIEGIRAAYTRDFTNKDMTKKQIAVATYLIDKLALRAGNEKDDDEADTVGCCTLKVENVEPLPPHTLKFDFLGKDSIRYQNEVEVELPVFKAIQQFRVGKKGSDNLFDQLDTSKLNAHLKELMPGLTAKVFRTYNASITLDDMLSRGTKGGDVAEKVVVYQHANKEVAIICNHQRTVSKSHSAQMTRLDEKIDELKGLLDELKSDLARAKKGKPPVKSSDGKSKRNLAPEALERKIAQTNAKIEKMERDKLTKEDLKTVALGTSKINYLDPRITVAWCKRYEVPIEKMFNKSLLAKFAWAMDVEPDFRF